MNEFWINNDQDFKEFKQFIKDENCKIQITGKDSEGNTLVKAGDFLVHIPTVYKLVEEKIKYDPLIFGKDQTEQIVNISVRDDDLLIYFKDGNHIQMPYKKWAVGANWDNGCQTLKGHQFYKFIKELTNEQYQTLKENWNPRIWIPRSPEEGFMLRSGYTYFKGMKVNEVSLYSLDIEATTLNPNDEDAKVVLLSRTFRDNTGKSHKKIFDIFEYVNVHDFFHAVFQDIKKTNPDIILGHNILSYDLPYLNKQSIAGLYWGRDGSAIKFDERISKFRKDGSQQYDYTNAHIVGRDIVDTMFLSIKYDISRDFTSYGLKSIEKQLELVDGSRIEWDFQKWPVKKLVQLRSEGTKEGIELWDKFKEYCSSDSDSPIKLFDLMVPAFFYLAQIVPKTLQQMINEASGSQLDAIMIRSYLQDGYSIPRSSKPHEYEGAISMGVPGVYENVLKFDVASLYPSIMLEYNIYDKKKDPNRNMLKILEYLRSQRLQNKKLAKQTSDKYYDDLQASQKIMINSMYGFMGANYLLYNFPDGAELVTKRGREINLKGIEWGTGYSLKKEIKKIVNEGEDNQEEKYHWVLDQKVSEGKGYTLVNTDTDSFSMTNGKRPSKEEFDQLLKDLNSNFSEMISWEDDGIFDSVIVSKSKNYVLVQNGKIKFKGSSFTDQKKEPALTEFLQSAINIILNNKTDYNGKLVDLYTQYCLEALNIKDIKRWCTKKTVTKSILDATTVASKKALDACKEAISKNSIGGIQEGDKVWLYQYIKGMTQKIVKGEPQFKKKTGEPILVEDTGLRVPELFDGNYDKWHYVSRVYSTLVILENIIDIKTFPKYHIKSQNEALLKLL